MNKNMKGMALHIEEQIEMDFDAFLRSFNQNKDCSFAFLLGAGASITSGVQSVEDCIWDWKRLIYISKNPTKESFIDIHSDSCRKKVQAWIDEQGGYPKENSEEEYVFYAERTFPLSGDRTKYFNKSVDKYINLTNRLLRRFYRGFSNDLENVRNSLLCVIILSNNPCQKQR